MYLRRKKTLIVSLSIAMVLVVIVAVGTYFIVREFCCEEPDDREVCIKTRCMPPSELFRRSVSSYICSPDECVITSSNISDIIDTTCVDTECITRGKKGKYRKVNSTTICLDTMCLKASAVIHLKAGGNCSSEDCIVSAGEVLKSMDQTIRPCDDFYAYACRGTTKHNIQGNQKTYIVEKALSEALSAPVQHNDSDSLKKTKSVYQTCVSAGSLEIKNYTFLSNVLQISEVGDWPLLELKDPNLNCRNELERRTAMLHVYGVETFFRLEVDFSDEDSTSFIKMSVAPPLFQDICTGQSEDLRQKHKRQSDMLVKMFTLLLKEEELAQRVTNGMKRFDRLFCLATKIRNSTDDEPSRITMQELAQMSPKFDWKLWHSIVSSHFDVDARLKNAPVYVYDVQLYINNIVDLVDSRSDWVDYLNVKFMLSYMGFLDRPFQDIMTEYRSSFKDHTTYGLNPATMTPRSKLCQKYLQKTMGIALIPPFISKMITAGVQREMEYLGELVKHSFKETFHNSRVLYDQEKKQIMKTITKFGVFLLYPDENSTFYDEYYSDMKLSGGSFLETGMQVRSFHQKKIFQAVYSGAHDYNLELQVLLQNPFETYAFATVAENKTVIFIGGIHVAGVKPDLPRYMNFATLGTTIALEYVEGSHLLSINPGRDTFDLKAKEWRPWPRYIRRHVAKKRQCYINRYYTQAQDSGDIIVQEMMADVQALKESLQAYRIYCEKYGHEPLLPIPHLNEKDGDEQLFFILYAQSLCNAQPTNSEVLMPVTKRVNEVLRNLEDFADAFHCEADTPMNPTDKCGTVW